MATALKVRARLRFSELMEELDKEYDDYIHALMEKKRQIRKKMLDQFVSHMDTITISMSANDNGGLSQPSFGLNDDIPFEIEMDESLDIEIGDQEPETENDNNDAPSVNSDDVNTIDDANDPLVVVINGENRFQCQYCSHTTPNKAHWKIHEMRHRGEKPYSCSYCDYRAVRKDDVATHERRKHSNAASFDVDEESDAGTDDSSDCVSAEKESEKPSLKCRYCNYVTTSHNILKQHEMRHTGEKPHKCAFCQYRAVTKREVFLHTKNNHASTVKNIGRKSTRSLYYSKAPSRATTIAKRRSARNVSKVIGKTLFKCRYCAYQAPQKCTLKDHEMRHSGQKPHKCSYCEYRAVTRKEVVRHEKTHSGDRKYPCRFCAYRGQTQQALVAKFRRFVCKFFWDILV